MRPATPPPEESGGATTVEAVDEKHGLVHRPCRRVTIRGGSVEVKPEGLFQRLAAGVVGTLQGGPRLRRRDVGGGVLRVPAAQHMLIIDHRVRAWHKIRGAQFDD